MRRSCLLSLCALAGAALCATPVWAQIANPETEPNDSKAAATTANSGGAGMQAGDFLTGTSTSSSTTGIDTFRVTMKTAPLGIYEHRLVITSPTVGHTGSIRGLAQSAGVITPGGDVAAQSSSTLTTPTRINLWYGFGKGEQFFYRVTGGTATTEPYTCTIETTPITPIVIPDSIASGNITISSIGQATADTDFWVYDANFNPVATFGNDDESIAGGGTATSSQSIATRNLPAGTYYIAMGVFNLANNQPSPADDDFRTGNVLDFPNMVTVSSTSSTSINVSFSITHPGGTASVIAARPVPYGIAWYQFTVEPAANPAGIGAATPSSVNNCGGATTLLTVQAVSGNPVNNVFTVSAEASALGLGSIALTDDGMNGDQTANDLIFSRTVTVPLDQPTGATLIPFTVTDGLNRQGTGNISLTVTACPPANDLIANAISVTLGTPVDGTTVGATTDTAPTCVTTVGAPGVWYKLVGDGNTITVDTCASLAPYDSKINVYCADGSLSQFTCVTGNDDSCGGLSSVTFCSQPGNTYYILVNGFGGAVGEFTLTANTDSTPCSGAVACLPTGRCCLPDDTCAILTEIQCTTQMGTYGGNGTDCLASTGSFASTNTFPIAIPDNDVTGASATIVIPPGSGTANSLAIRVGLTHTWIGDLLATISNGTTTVTLLGFVGDLTGTDVGDSSDLGGTYTFFDAGADIWAAAASGASGFVIPSGIYAPADFLTGALPSPSLAAFDGSPLEGTWTLTVFDAAPLDTGSISSFSIINGFNPTGNPCVGAVCFVDFNADGFLNQEDLGGYLTVFLDETIPAGPSGTSQAPCPGAPAPYDMLGYAADYNRDCNFDQEDLGGFITEFFNESENPTNCIPG